MHTPKYAIQGEEPTLRSAEALIRWKHAHDHSHRCSEDGYEVHPEHAEGRKEHEARFDKLASSIEARDLDAAFDAAHALKGVTGNLALTPLYQAIFDITEFLRARTDTDYSELIKSITELRDQLAALCVG